MPKLSAEFVDLLPSRQLIPTVRKPREISDNSPPTTASWNHAMRALGLKPTSANELNYARRIVKKELAREGHLNEIRERIAELAILAEKMM